MKALLREPLLHCLLLGMVLFQGYEYLNRGLAEPDSQTIVVARDKLVTFIQYRSRVFDATRFNSLLDSLPKEEHRPGITDEEILAQCRRQWDSYLKETSPVIVDDYPDQLLAHLRALGKR